MSLHKKRPQGWLLMPLEEYIHWRDESRCQLCGVTESPDGPLHEVHYIIRTRSQIRTPGRAYRGNWILLCHACRPKTKAAERGVAPKLHQLAEAAEALCAKREARQAATKREDAARKRRQQKRARAIQRAKVQRAQELRRKALDDRAWRDHQAALAQSLATPRYKRRGGAGRPEPGWLNPLLFD
jgi:hypothetical protein